MNQGFKISFQPLFRVAQFLTAYSGLSGRLFRNYPDSKPETSGHFVDDMILC